MKNLSKYMKIFFIAAGILLLYKLMFDGAAVSETIGQLFGVIKPFVWGFVFAYCINIPCERLDEKLQKIKFKWIRKISRPASVTITLIATATALFFGIRGLVPMIYENGRQLLMLMPEYLERGLASLNKLPFIDELQLDEWIDTVINEKPWEALLPGAEDSLRLATDFFSGIFGAILTIVSTIYFTAEYNKVKNFFKRLIRACVTERYAQVMRYIRLVNSSFRKFISCQTLDSLILASITMIEFAILGSPYAVVLGLMLGVLNIIPYFGSIFGSLIAVFIMWSTNGLQTALITALVLLITQQIDGNIINPRIMGTSFSVSPVLVIIGITVGGAIGGVAGMIFAIPAVNILKTVLEEYLQNKEKSKQELTSGQNIKGKVNDKGAF